VARASIIEETNQVIPKEVTLSSLSKSLAKNDEAIAKVLEAHALRVVSRAATEAFAGLVKELRVQGFSLEPFGVQTDAELHYRAPLSPELTSKRLVFALDIVITVGAAA
jgi:hypothetical protein